MPRVLATLLSVAALIVCAAAAAASASPSSSARIAQTTSTGVTGITGVSGVVALGPTKGPPVTITTDPVGLSIEYSVMVNDLGSGPCPPPALVTTLEALGSPAIRIGGDSGDQTAPAGTPPFTGVTDLPANFWSQLACLEAQTHEPFVIGLNLASQTPAWAAEMAAGASSAVPANLLSFELGNEADIVGPSVPWWNATALARTFVPFATYLQDAEATEAQLGPGADVEGPDFATFRWIGEIPVIAKALSLHTIDTHFYPLNACTGRNAVSIRALLTAGASDISPAVRATLEQAVSLQLPMLISESNSVACRGLAGVSNSPASAVWAMRLIINALRSGIISVRFHSSASSYDPFVVSGTTVTVRPLYLALRAAVELIPLGASLDTLRTPSALLGVVVAPATGGKTYIVSSYADRSIAVTVPAHGRVALIRLVARAPVVEDQTAEAHDGIATVSVEPNSVVAITVPGPAPAPTGTSG